MSLSFGRHICSTIVRLLKIPVYRFIEPQHNWQKDHNNNCIDPNIHMDHWSTDPNTGNHKTIGYSNRLSFQCIPYIDRSLSVLHPTPVGSHFALFLRTEAVLAMNFVLIGTT